MEGQIAPKRRSALRYRTPTDVRAVLRRLRYLSRATHAYLNATLTAHPSPYATEDDTERGRLDQAIIDLQEALAQAHATLRAYKAGAYRVPRATDGIGMLQPDDRNGQPPDPRPRS